MSCRWQPLQLSCRPSLPPPSLCRAFHCRCHCRRRISVAPLIAVAVASPLHLPSPSPLRCRRVVHRLRRKCLAAGGHYDGVVCSLPRRHPPTRGSTGEFSRPKVKKRFGSTYARKQIEAKKTSRSTNEAPWKHNSSQFVHPQNQRFPLSTMVANIHLRSSFRDVNIAYSRL